MRRLRPFFSYHGAKALAAPWYPAPQHERLIEPFAGSACYALRYPDRRVVLIEKYPVLAAVWRYLIAVREREILALPDVEDETSVAALPVCQEARWLIGFNLRKAQARPGLTPSAWMRAHRWRGFWGPHQRERIARQLCAIRHWTLIEGDYTRAPGGPATWFVDPPYQHKGQNYACGNKQIDYPALGLWCRSREGQVIVCEAAGADWLPFQELRPVRSAASRGKVGRSCEMVWTNAGGVQEHFAFGEMA